MVALAERHALADEVVRELGGKHLGRQGGSHVLRERGEGGEHAGGDLDAVGDGLDVVEEGLDAFLEVFVVGCREALDGHHEAGHLAEGAAGLATKEFQTVCLLLAYYSYIIFLLKEDQTYRHSSSGASKKTPSNTHQTSARTQTPDCCR